MSHEKEWKQRMHRCGDFPHIVYTEYSWVSQQIPRVDGRTEIHTVKKDLITTPTSFPAIPNTFAPQTFSEQFLNVRTVIFFTQKLAIIVFISQTLEPRKMYVFSSDYLPGAWWVCLWLYQASNSRIPRIMKTKPAIAILMRFSTV